MKTCSKCKAEKAFSEFHKNRSRKDGLRDECKDCLAACRKEKYREENPNARNRIDKLWQKDNPGMKWCSRCKSGKTFSEFFNNRSRDDGLSGHCKECTLNQRREAYIANPDKFRERSKKWDKKNQDCARRRRVKWQAKRRRESPAHALTNRARAQSNQALRGCCNSPGFFRHMPYTKDQFATHLILTLPEGYTEADVCDGSKLHIDHIRPVSSFNLTGEVDDEFLACWALSNLQLLPAAENLAKGDSYNPAD